MDSPEFRLLTLEEVVASMKAALPENFPLLDNDPFSVFNTYLELSGQAATDSRNFTVNVSPQGFVQYATGFWLDWHAASMSITRIPAQFAEGEVTLTLSSGGTIPKNAIFQTTADSEGVVLRYWVQEDTVVTAPSGTVKVRAETAGAKYNVGSGRINTLVTVLPFVTDVNNGSGWLLSAGVDTESDELLRERLMLRFPSLSDGGVWKNYAFWMRSIDGITKVKVLDQHPRGQGTADVIIAPNTGMPSSSQLQQGAELAELKRPITADVLVKAPTPITLNVSVTVYKKSSSNTSAETFISRIRAAIDKMGIGDTFYPSMLSDTLHNDPDVLGVTINTPAAPVAIAADALITAGIVSVTTS